MNQPLVYNELIKYFLFDVKEYDNWKIKILKQRLLEEEISDLFNIPMEDLLNKRRYKELVDARRAYFYILHEIMNKGCSYIGKKSGFDHATIIYNCKKCKNILDTEPCYRQKVDEIIKKIYRQEIITKI